MSANQDEPRPHLQERLTATSSKRKIGAQWTTALLLAAAVLVGTVIRAVVLSQFTPPSLLGDEADYLARGVRLARTGAFDGIDRAPGYIFFLAAMAKWSSVPLDAARWGQIALGAISTVLLFFVARPAVGTKPATAAAWLFALCPTFIGFTQLFYSEPLYTCLLLAATLALLRAWETRSVGSTILAGLLLGASALVKSISLTLALVFAGCWFLREKPRSAVLRTTIFLASFAVVIFPYAWRNHVRYGGWVLIDTSVSRTLWHANHIDYRPGFDWDIAGLETHFDGSELPTAGADPVRSHQELLRRELGFVLKHPGLVVARIPEKIGAFWNPTSFVQRALARDDIPKLPRESIGALVLSLFTTSYFAAVLFLGIIGLLRAGQSPLRTCFLSMLGTFAFVHLFMVCQSRYRLSLMPFFMIFAAHTLLNRSGPLGLGPWRTGTAVALMGAMLILWWPYLPYVLMQRLEAW